MEKKYLKQKYMWAVAAALLLVICYQLAFKKTIVAWQLHKRLELQMRQSSDVSMPPAYLKRKDRNLGGLLNLYRPADTSRDEVINRVADIAESEHLKVEEVPRPDTSTETGGYIIQRLILSGEYFATLRSLQKLDQNKGVGVIRSLTLKTAKGPELKNDRKLLLEISFEHEK
jgi:hypothetical protein